MSEIGLHYENQLLPLAVQEGILLDQQASIETLSKELNKVNDKLVSITHDQDEELIRALEKLLRVMKQHHNLHYPFLLSFRRSVVLTLQTSFFHLHHYASLSFRLKLLNNIKLMLSKRWESLDNLARDDNRTYIKSGPDAMETEDSISIPFTIDPMPYWREAMSLLQREDRHDVVAGETALTDYMKGLASFIISCRHYYSKTNVDIVRQALHRLSDITIPHCVDGLLMLYSLVPTDYRGCEGVDYDSSLPTFIQLWSGINHNP
eukprot:gene43310-52939_t